MTVDVLSSGLQTTIQDFPGRRGMLRDGVPPSGPLDDWSFRLANLLVGNAAGEAALEIQFLGPTLRFGRDALISICGGDLLARIGDAPAPMWESVRIRAGQVLTFGGAVSGARAYLAIAGGFDVPVVMGSRSTYVTARLGGFEGAALAAGQSLAVGKPYAAVRPRRAVKVSCRPPISASKVHSIDVVAGPSDDWIAAEGRRLFYEAEWELTSRSDRVGFRIRGPQITFAKRAYDKHPDNGEHPSNIIEFGYPIGGINWAGETPIILMHDCITLGGFIVPFTVPSSEFWKLAQARPGEVFRFSPVDIVEAQIARRRIDLMCSSTAIEP